MTPLEKALESQHEIDYCDQREDSSSDDVYAGSGIWPRTEM